MEAFAQLTAEGFLEPQPGSGTRVAHYQAPRRTPHANVQASSAVAVPLSSQAQHLARFAAQARALPPVPFTVSVPIGDTAPDDVWRRLGNRVRARGPGAPSGYGDPLGALPLREAICDYVRRSRSVNCTPQQILITSGTQQGLYLAAQILLDAGDSAWVEDPAYAGITAIFDSLFRDRHMIRVPVADDGIDVAAGVRLAADARAAFVTPSHQYPLGMPMSMAKSALLAWAKERQAWIVEDDYDSEMRYAGHPFPSLQGLAPERTLYLGTFSKMLFPSLRLGYAVVPPPLVDAFAAPGSDGSPSAQRGSTRAGRLYRRRVSRPAYPQNARRLRRETPGADRGDQHAYPPELAVVQPCDQGMHMVLWLRKGLDDVRVAQCANEAGLALRAVSPICARPR